MKIVFDLDHTLFKANLFKKDLFEILYSAGAKAETVEKTYQEHCKKEAGGAYNFKKHCLKIENETTEFDIAKAIEGLGLPITTEAYPVLLG